MLDTVHFHRAGRHTHKETIDITGNVRNMSNRATTIEKIYLHFGRWWIPMDSYVPIRIEPNSSHNLDLHHNFKPEDFKEILGEGEVTLGIEIVHTFGRLKKLGKTDFKTDYLNLS